MPVILRGGTPHARMGGKDASKQFWKYHGDGVLKKYGPKLKIGDLAESAKL